MQGLVDAQNTHVHDTDTKQLPLILLRSIRIRQGQFFVSLALFLILQSPSVHRIDVGLERRRGLRGHEFLQVRGRLVLVGELRLPPELKVQPLQWT